MLGMPLDLSYPSSPVSPSVRCNLQDLLSGLETLAGILIDNEFSLEALPLLALWDYVSCKVVRWVPAYTGTPTHPDLRP